MKLKSNHTDFEKEIARRGIEYLVHFTPSINLYSILEQKKILSRALLEKFDIEQTDIFDYIEFTDEIRHDDKSYINLSVQFPNYYLFNRFREKTKDEMHITWCVLKVDPQFIYHHDTLFSVTNAANSNNKRTYGISGDFEKFKMLFANEITIVTSYGSRVARRNNLKEKYTTDEQAEVLVRDEIHYSDILSICFQNEKELASAKAALSEFNTSKFVVDESLFNSVRK